MCGGRPGLNATHDPARVHCPAGWHKLNMRKMIRLAGAVLAFIIGIAPAAGVAEKQGSPAPIMNGVITGIEKDGMVLNIKSRGGRQSTLELPAGVKVIRPIDLSKVKKGDRIYAILGDVNGEMLMRRGVVNGDRVTKKNAEPDNGRIRGKVADVDLAARLLKVKTGLGEVKSIKVAPRVRINAFTGVQDLKEGDSVVLISQGPFDPAKIRTVIVNSGCPGKF